MLVRGCVLKRLCMRMRGIVTFVLRLMLRRTGLVPAERHGGGHQSLRRQGEDDQHQHEFLKKTIHSEHSIGDVTIVQLKTGGYRRYSTVTDLARFLGLSTSLPRSSAA